MDGIDDEYLNDLLEKLSPESFNEVIALHCSQDIPWKEIKDKDPFLPRGWFELAHLTTEDRIEFTRQYWLGKLPYHQKLEEAIDNFFSSLAEIGIYLLQKDSKSPFESNLIYHLKEGKGFFRGKIGCSEEKITSLEKVFKGMIPPIDYVEFLRIHNGFSKATDTGILSTEVLEEKTLHFRSLLDLEDPLITATGALVNPDTLIPFYESFGMPVYQCFWTEWYPDSEMGNVYYTGLDNTLSDVIRSHTSTDNLAFKSFSDWLVFYLEILA